MWYSIKTLRFYTGTSAVVHVLSYDKKIVPRDCLWIDANQLKCFIPEKPQGYVSSTMCFAKLLLPALPELEGLSKVLYIDNDIEIASSHFLDIFNEDFCGAEALAVKEPDKMCNGHSGKWRYKQVASLAKLMPEKAKTRLRKKEYVNSGLVMFNLDEVKVQKPRYIDFIMEAFGQQQLHPKICCMQDEDLLNMLFDVKVVSPKYAMQTALWKDGSSCFAVHYNQGKAERDYPPKKRRRMFPESVFSKEEHGFQYRDACSKIYPEKPDVVYVVGKPDKCKDNYQLRCSLRSIAKHGKNVGRVIVAGYPPDWLSAEVVKVYVEDTPVDGVIGKHWNILNCIKHAILKCNITKPFLYSSDDHFYIKDIDFSKHPRYYLTERLYSEPFLLKQMPDKKTWGWYLTNIVNTRKLLDAESLPCRWAAVHADTWMYPQYLLNVLEIAYKHKDLCPNVGFEPTCMFNAFFERDWPCEPFSKIEANDRKVMKAEDIQQKVDSGVPTFTVHALLDKDSKTIDAMMKLLPDRCKYEKD